MGRGLAVQISVRPKVTLSRSLVKSVTAPVRHSSDVKTKTKRPHVGTKEMMNRNENNAKHFIVFYISFTFRFCVVSLL